MNFSELVPEALTLVSRDGVVAPERMPELSPYVPEISEAASKPTHFSTPVCAHRVGKSWLPGGGVDTVTFTEAYAVPLDPVQVRVNVLLLVNGPVDWLSEVALAPDHAPEAKHVASVSVEDQVSVEAPPPVTDVGFAASDTPGFAAEGLFFDLSAPLQAANSKTSTRTSSKIFVRNMGSSFLNRPNDTVSIVSKNMSLKARLVHILLRRMNSAPVAGKHHDPSVVVTLTVVPIVVGLDVYSISTSCIARIPQYRCVKSRSELQ